MAVSGEALETRGPGTEWLHANAVYQKVAPGALELSVLGAPTEARQELYDKIGVEWTDQRPLAPQLAEEVAPGALVLVKAECDQKVGSYKIRGAGNALYKAVSADPGLRRVETASAGNHAQGVRQAAHALGIQIVVAHTFEGIVKVKEDALTESGVEVVKHTDFNTAEEVAQLADSKPGSAYIPAFNSFGVMEGQSTIGSEMISDLLERAQRGEVDLRKDQITLVFPGGGGGCASGNAVLIHTLKDAGILGDNVRFVVAQMEGSHAIALEAQGKHLDVAHPHCDGTKVTKPGDKNMAILRDKRFVQDIVVMPEAFVGEAMHVLRRHHGHDVEPAGALSMAGVMWLAEQDAPHQAGEGKQVYLTVTSGKNVTSETVRYFYSKASEARRRAAEELSQAYLDREVYGLAEKLQAVGRTTLKTSAISGAFDRSQSTNKPNYGPAKDKLAAEAGVDLEELQRLHRQQLTHV